jgi:transposase-like protein
MRFRTKDEIEKHLSAQRSSGMSISAYCKQENISQNTFFNWRKRFPKRVDTSPTVPFLKLPFAAPAAERLDLTLPNGAQISVPLSFDVPILRDVVRLLAPLRPRR